MGSIHYFKTYQEVVDILRDVYGYDFGRICPPHTATAGMLGGRLITVTGKSARRLR